MSKNDPDNLAQISCEQFKDGAWRSFADTAAPEIPITLTLDSGKEIRLWAFPHDLPDLALGHALLDHCPPGHAPSVKEITPRTFTVRFVPVDSPGPAPRPVSLTVPDILQNAVRFMELPGHFKATGCFHRAALYDPAARGFIRHAEDIGRHNCLDRLAGWAFGQGLTLCGFALFVTARATASLVTKAVRSGCAIMISRSAVTTGAVALARAAGMTLIGFSRENRFSVFTDPQARVVHE